MRYHPCTTDQNASVPAPDFSGGRKPPLYRRCSSGFEVIKQVKANPATAHLPIVVNSSMSGSSNEDMARSLNADEFISKSNPVEIEAAVRRFALK